jgi:hypothetical protein
MQPAFLRNLLDDDIEYDNMSKYDFIGKLNETFNDFKTHGDYELILSIDYCNSCNCNRPVFKFIGTYSRKQFALYFEIEGDLIKDIYCCKWYGDDDSDYPF